jgi:hypothetical protein
LPDAKVCVVDDRVLDLVAQHDLADVVGLFLVLKLGGMNADHDEVVRVFRFEPLEIGDDVDTVDATVSPEIQQHYFASERGERKRLIGVEPSAPMFEFGRTHAPAIRYGHLRTLLPRPSRAAPAPRREPHEPTRTRAAPTHTRGIKHACCTTSHS